ncbi:MAG: GIY-YIG nuclease family protein [Bacteroidetes bacterium]|nr:GIY-YIG nuclease family protein [Bacteroidota bacterium]
MLFESESTSETLAPEGESRNTYYVGCTQTSVADRIEKHNTAALGRHFTSQTKDWNLFLEIPCESFRQARKIELHIKRMKSRKYIENLKVFPEIIQKLLHTNKDDCENQS